LLYYFTIAKLWNQSRYPTTDECIKKMEFYSAIRKNETMWFEGKWMQLEDKPGSEDKGHMFSLIYGRQTIQIQAILLQVGYVKGRSLTGEGE
jgi:hypothetical protein